MRQIVQFLVNFIGCVVLILTIPFWIVPFMVGCAFAIWDESQEEKRQDLITARLRAERLERERRGYEVL